MRGTHHSSLQEPLSTAADPLPTEKPSVAGVELRHLRGFVAVAEKRNFTRAAVDLNVTQPALSRTIAQLERLLGVELLHRTRHVVELTPQGEVFLLHTRRALVVIDETLRSVGKDIAPVRVGFTYLAAAAYIAPIVRAFEKAHPGTIVELHRIDDPLAGLGDGRSHVGFLPIAPEDPRIETSVLSREPRVAAIPIDHPLARRRSLRLRDLRTETLVINVVSGSTTLDLWKRGDAPASIVEVDNVEEWLEAIAAARGIGMTPAAASRMYTHPQICYRQILDAPPVPVVMAWPAKGAHPLTADFVAAAASGASGAAA
jgi:DNA-binding transcriptional LysR family regulator